MRGLKNFIVIMLFCLLGTGCALFNRDSTPDRNRFLYESQEARNREKRDSTDTVKGKTPSSMFGGMLAGRILEKDSGQPVKAFIRWNCLEDDGANDTVVDAATDAKGHFNIEGLKPNKRYKLIARTKQGTELLAGTGYATTPNGRIVILVSKEFVTADTPDVPPPSPFPEDVDGTSPFGAKRTDGGFNNTPGSVKVPDAKQANRDNNGFVGDPTPIGNGAKQKKDTGFNGWDATPKANQGSKDYPENMANGENRFPRNPLLRTNPIRKNDTLPAPKKGDWGTAPSNKQTNYAPKRSNRPDPYCDLVGKRLENLAVRDLQGKVWEWKVDRRGKLVLIDFWFTSCLPCQDAIPKLRDLQAKYGWAGLEVIGIAHEKQGTFAQKRDRIARIANHKQTNYRLLLSSGKRNDPLINKFGVRFFPTMVLLDADGNILWRHVGGLTPRNLADLDVIMRSRLDLNKTAAR